LSDSDDHSRGRAWHFGRTSVRLANPIILASGFILVVSLIFLIFPGIDPWFTGLFYDPDSGFPLSRLEALKVLRSLGRWMMIAVVVTLVAAIIGKLARPARPIVILPGNILFLLSTLALGPGLVVNFIFKEHWGRPRPATVELFGGEAPFVTVWRMSDYCLSNCSFVSGEASAAIWLVAFALVVPAGWRRAAVVILTALAIMLSLNRVAFGRHFLSDILLAWGFTLFVLAVMHRIIVENPPNWLQNDRLEAWLTRLGLKLRWG
jgi:lipid A 4'-phosphatase